MSTEHILHTDPHFAISVDERSSRFNLIISTVPGGIPVEYDLETPYPEGAYLSTEIEPMDLARLAIRALQAASYHMSDAEEAAARQALVESLPGWGLTR